MLCISFIFISHILFVVLLTKLLFFGVGLMNAEILYFSGDVKAKKIDII